MIEYKLMEMQLKSHPKNGLHGIIIHGAFINYPVTIVDNHMEIQDGEYTGYPVMCLLHLNENVRLYKRLQVFREFNYIDDARQTPTYRMYDYAQSDVSTEQAIEILQRVLYYDRPELEESSASEWDIPNPKVEEDKFGYKGRYVLNDEEEYIIRKHKDRYGIYKVRLFKKDALLHEGPLNFDLYRLSVEVSRLRSKILSTINLSLDQDEEDFSATYHQLHAQLKERLKTEWK